MRAHTRTYTQLLAAHALASSVAVRQGTVANASIPYPSVPEAFPVEFAATGNNPPETAATARSEQAVDHAKARRLPVGGLLGLAGGWLESALVGAEPAGHGSLTGTASGGIERELGGLNPFDDRSPPAPRPPPPGRPR